MKKLSVLSIVFFLLIAGCSEKHDYQLSEIDNPSGPNSSLPRLFTDNTGRVFMSWVEQNEKQSHFKYSTYTGTQWTEPQEIASDSTWFVNWADFPSLIARDGKPVSVHWLNKIPGNTYSYNIEVASFNDNWSNSMVPHKDKTRTEHGFLSMIPAGENQFLAAWLDGRNTAGRAHDEYSDLSKAMTLRAAFFNQTTNKVEQRFELDASICDCCNTSIAQTANGYIVAYRNRTQDEIRDIYYTRFSNGSWSNPAPVHNDNWKIAACPVNGPAVDAKGKNVAMAWYTAANDTAKIKLAISNNEAKSFEDAVIVDDENPAGRLDLNIIDDKIWISWMGESADQSVLKIRSYDLSGNMIDDFQIEGTSKQRSSGFPQITKSSDGLVIAYTDVSGIKPIIKTASIQ